jgi:hypothetical protein
MKVKLTAPHTHAGKRCAIGDEIDVTERERQWLEARGAIEKSKTVTAPVATNQETTR